MRIGTGLPVRVLAALVLAASVAACDGLKDLSTVYTALGEHFHEPMNVNLNNGSHLVITLVNVPERELDDAGREAYAHDVAAFAKSHWPHPGTLDDITVAYSSQSSTGPLTITRSNGVFRWKTDQLATVAVDSGGGVAPGPGQATTAQR